MNNQYTEENIQINKIFLDQYNPRFPPVNNQREAIQAMLRDQGSKIVTLAADIYQRGLNPSSKPILFKENSRYIDGDGNRRVTALKILETPSLADSEPKVRKKIDAILKKDGVIPSEVSCVIFKNRKDANHWISVNHNGPQDGKGQIAWDSEQKNRFEGKFTVGLQALDLLSHRKMISNDDKLRVNKTTLDRLLSYKKVKEKLAIVKNGELFSFGWLDGLSKVVLSLRDEKVDVVYTAEKGIAFAEKALDGDSNDIESVKNSVDNVSFNGEGSGKNGSNELDDGGKVNSYEAEDNQNYGKQNNTENLEVEKKAVFPRTRRKNASGLKVFGGPLSLQAV